MRVFAVRNISLHNENTDCAIERCERVVYLSEAEAEIEKARKEGYEKGQASSGSWMKAKEEDVRADEREAIINMLLYCPYDPRTNKGEAHAIQLICSRGYKPATVEKLLRTGNLLTVYEIADRLNELIDALKAKSVL
jgi:hypothetical protein